MYQFSNGRDEFTSGFPRGIFTWGGKFSEDELVRENYKLGEFTRISMQLSFLINLQHYLKKNIFGYFLSTQKKIGGNLGHFPHPF